MRRKWTNGSLNNRFIGAGRDGINPRRYAITHHLVNPTTSQHKYFNLQEVWNADLVLSRVVRAVCPRLLLDQASARSNGF
jgi:hypothetical protein